LLLWFFEEIHDLLDIVALAHHDVISPGLFLYRCVCRQSCSYRYRRDAVDCWCSWTAAPSSINAYYTPIRNEIIFLAGILQPPFFDNEYPKWKQTLLYRSIRFIALRMHDWSYETIFICFSMCDWIIVGMYYLAVFKRKFSIISYTCCYLWIRRHISHVYTPCLKKQAKLYLL